MVTSILFLSDQSNRFEKFESNDVCYFCKLGYLSVDRLDLSKGIEDTKQIEQALKMDQNILIFPEGTFGYASGLRPFRLGAFKISSDVGVPICPIALQGTRSILRSGEKLLRPNQVTVTVCDPIIPSGNEWRDVTHLRDKVRDSISKHCGEPVLDFIRAQTAPHFQSAFTIYNGKKLFILEADVEHKYVAKNEDKPGKIVSFSNKGDDLLVNTGTSGLIVKKVRYEGFPEMWAKDLYYELEKMKLGDCFGE